MNIQNRDFDDIIRIYNIAGIEVRNQIIPKLKQILASEYQNICSLNNFNDALKEIENGN